MHRPLDSLLAQRIVYRDFASLDRYHSTFLRGGDWITHPVVLEQRSPHRASQVLFRLKGAAQRE